MSDETATCACVYSADDGDEAAFSSRTVIKARKPHTCGECRQPIPVGARYERVSGKWDGEIDTFRTCLDCVEIRVALFCEGWIYTNVWEDIEESWRMGANPLGCITALASVTAKQKLQQRYQKFLGLEAQ